MPAVPGHLVVWECPRARFMVGFRKNGQIVLTCLEDLSETVLANEDVAWEFAKGYTPNKKD